jgi:plasmid segregation protein ParM
MIGLDIGHSAVKIAAGNNRQMFPTAACPAANLAVDEAAKAAKADTVRLNGKDYFVGQTALIHTAGRLLDGLSDDWIETPEHLALMIAGYHRAKASIDDENPLLVMGLPSRLHARQHQRLRELAVMHLHIPLDRVRVVPQPVGAFMGLALDEQGQPVANRSIDTERWGVIDVGYYTTDFGLLIGGIWSHAGARSIAGANTVADALRERIANEHKTTISLRAADEALRTGTLRLYGRTIDVSDHARDASSNFARQIIEGAVNTFGETLPSLDGILIAGGGADLVFPHLQKEFPHAVCAETPRFAIAEGLRRFGIFINTEQVAA